MNILRSMLAMILVLGIASGASAEETIRLASGEWPPYQSEGLKYHGVVSRIVEEAFTLEGIKVEYGYFPWKRSYHMAEIGEWDGTFIWFDLPERRMAFYISDSIVDINYVFFHLKSHSFDWNNIDDLKELRIGGTLGYDYGEAFQNAEKTAQIRVIRKPSDEINFSRLTKGEIHIFPCDLNAGYAIIRKNFTSNEIKLFTHDPQPIKSAPHHLLLSKKIKHNKRMIELFNKGLKRLRELGKYDQYFDESRRGEYVMNK